MHTTHLPCRPIFLFHVLDPFFSFHSTFTFVIPVTSFQRTYFSLSKKKAKNHLHQHGQKVLPSSFIFSIRSRSISIINVSLFPQKFNILFLFFFFFPTIFQSFATLSPTSYKEIFISQGNCGCFINYFSFLLIPHIFFFNLLVKLFNILFSP